MWIVKLEKTSSTVIADVCPRPGACVSLGGLSSPHFQVVVQHVHFDGLGRTKDDIIMYEIGDVFKAKNLIEASIFSAWHLFHSLLKML